MKSSEHKAVIITGGNSGIGYAAAQEFKNQGAYVGITGRRAEAIQKASQELGVRGYVADQSSLADIDSLVATVKNDFEKIDVLVINAGVASFQPIELTEEKQFDTMLNVNFKGAFFTLQKFIPILNDNASVIFISSNGASITSPGTSVYAASKAALNVLMKTAAVELSSRNIRVNAISPGPTQTEMALKFGFDEQTLNGMKEMILTKVPLAKMGVPQDVAKMIAYLADNNTSSFITGAEFFIDGGMQLS